MSASDKRKAFVVAKNSKPSILEREAQKAAKTETPKDKPVKVTSGKPKVEAPE